MDNPSTTADHPSLSSGSVLKAAAELLSPDVQRRIASKYGDVFVRNEAARLAQRYASVLDDFAGYDNVLIVARGRSVSAFPCRGKKFCDHPAKSRSMRAIPRPGQARYTLVLCKIRRTQLPRTIEEILRGSSGRVETAIAPIRARTRLIDAPTRGDACMQLAAMAGTLLSAQ